MKIQGRNHTWFTLDRGRNNCLVTQMLTNTDPVDDEIYNEIEALLHTVQEYCKEQLTGVPVDISNPIVDLSLVQDVQCSAEGA